MGRTGILVISHGSRDPRWVAMVDDAVAKVVLPENTVIISAFLEIVEGRLIQDGINRLEELGVQMIVAVPLFMSSGSTHVDEIAYALGVQEEARTDTDLERFRVRVPIRMVPPMDDDPEVLQMLGDRIQTLSVQPARELLVLVGHGSREPGFYTAYRNGLTRLAQALQATGGFAQSGFALLLPDQLACKLSAWQRKYPELRPVVVPVFLSEGYFTKHVIPERMKGYTILYNGKALLPHPVASRWLERRIADALNEGSEAL
ncbi:cobalamin biosynthesis protein CbiX [Xylanibacillus composti]|uniref:Sirohydrochlorin ferrochelatase n=1 Tax=Xylanibacillus composti TaxID=1572762 RepID=A0A8J4H104_9BACL|nr:CbiX/SirB N-terminal domain-containing protein [Xylanibacillus composti]MDT9726896.1 cobalamin biosynthesis protein CbiX [Xylanibacillus composti]GIQ68909.1 hypothetical protein XYCOK13_17330 [Xylanibacillus composti]